MFGNFNRSPKPAAPEKSATTTTDPAVVELLNEKIEEVTENNPSLKAVLTDADIVAVREVLLRSQEATGTPYTVEDIQAFGEGLPEEIEAVVIKRLETRGIVMPSDVA